LASIRITSAVGAIDVYRMDFSSSTRARCLRVHDIGDAVFLLGDANMVASCPASALGLNANQIYFMRNLMKLRARTTLTCAYLTWNQTPWRLPESTTMTACFSAANLSGSYHLASYQAMLTLHVLRIIYFN
jgi:hypothetical protein